ncbi:MAG: hypothetical protein JW770_07790 [Actinobacteria bacterium]|nr:hypothetical protein [Actinomycetota bacterium]
MLILLLTIVATLIILSLSSCCIDYSKFLEPKSEEITISGSEEDSAKIGELLEEYNFGDKDFSGSDDSLDEENFQDIDYAEIKEELADTTGYGVSPEEEVEFFANLEGIYPEEKFIQVKEYLKDFKILYPAGYFTLINITQGQDYHTGYGWFEVVNDNNLYNQEVMEALKDFDISLLADDFYGQYSVDLITITHELTHCGSGSFIYLFVKDLENYQWGTYYSYLIGSQIVFIEKDKMFFSKYELMEDIEAPDYFDKTYLDAGETGASDIDFTMILDELNAYTVSAKCAVACEEYIKHSINVGFGLLKQMSHLELYLNRCYEKYPEDWVSISGNKGVAFLIMKLWLEAEKYADAVKDDERFNEGNQHVAEFIYHPDNYGTIEKYFSDSGILPYKDKTFQEVSGELDTIKIYDINQ